MRNSRVVYKLIVEDLQNVASDLLERKLTDEEIAFVAEKVGDFIPWYDAIENAIYHVKIPIASKQKKQRRKIIKGH